MLCPCAPVSQLVAGMMGLSAAGFHRKSGSKDPKERREAKKCRSRCALALRRMEGVATLRLLPDSSASAGSAPTRGTSGLAYSILVEGFERPSEDYIRSLLQRLVEGPATAPS